MGCVCPVELLIWAFMRLVAEQLCAGVVLGVASLLGSLAPIVLTTTAGAAFWTSRRQLPVAVDVTSLTERGERVGDGQVIGGVRRRGTVAKAHDGSASTGTSTGTISAETSPLSSHLSGRPRQEALWIPCLTMLSCGLLLGTGVLHLFPEATASFAALHAARKQPTVGAGSPMPAKEVRVASTPPGESRHDHREVAAPGGDDSALTFRMSESAFESIVTTAATYMLLGYLVTLVLDRCVLRGLLLNSSSDGRREVAGLTGGSGDEAAAAASSDGDDDDAIRWLVDHHGHSHSSSADGDTPHVAGSDSGSFPHRRRDPTTNMPKHSSRRFQRLLLLAFVLSFHTVIEGVSIAAESSRAHLWVGFGALLLHKFFDGLILGASYATGATRSIAWPEGRRAQRTPSPPCQQQRGDDNPRRYDGPHSCLGRGYGAVSNAAPVEMVPAASAALASTDDPLPLPSPHPELDSEEVTPMHDRSYRRSSVWLVCLFSMVTPCSVAVTLLVTSLTSSIGLTTYPNGDAAVRSPLISAGAVPPPPEGATTSSYGLAAAQAMGCG